MTLSFTFSYEIPTEDDTSTITKFLQELIEDKEIVNVSLLLKLFRRNVIDLGPEWKVAYQSVIEATQAAMVAEYGHELWLPE